MTMKLSPSRFPATSHSFLLLGVASVLATLSVPAFAATHSEQSISWGFMSMNLFGGLAIFLFGMEQMADALKAVAGERMKVILAKLTTNRFMGAMTGAFVTAIIQSSSVTTVLVVGFISAGLMSMAQSIGVIMGANIGTTITAQIVAFKVTKAALLMIAVGFSMLFFSKQERIKQYGGILMGLGMVFFGMSVMSDAMKPLRSYQPFLDLMVTMESPVIGILIAAAFTSLVQSSSATTGIVIVMASQGFITLPAGIALAFGANIGTCVTALLASIGKPREAVRAAFAHVLFNVLGVLLWVGFIDELAALVTTLSPVHEGLTSTEKLAAEAPRQIANAHTIFNVANTLIFIWLAGALARLVEYLVPDRPLRESVVVEPKFLDDELLDTPSLALERVRLEIGHTGQKVEQMVKDMMPAVLTGSKENLNELADLDNAVDILHGKIITYLGKISRKALTAEQSSIFLGLMEAANDLENIGDIIETNLVALGDKRISQNISVSRATQSVLENFHEQVLDAVQKSIKAVIENDQKAALDVIDKKTEITRLGTEASLHQAERLVAEEPGRLQAYTLETDIIEKLKGIYHFARRMAKNVVSEEALEKNV